MAPLSAFGNAFANAWIAKSAANKGGDNRALLSIIMTAAVALSVCIASGALHRYRARYDDLPGIALFASSGLLTIVVGRTLFFQSVAHIGAIRASAVNRLNLFFSVLLAAILARAVRRHQLIEVSRVVMITSAEIFIATALSVYVLKTERWPDRTPSLRP